MRLPLSSLSSWEQYDRLGLAVFGRNFEPFDSNITWPDHLSSHLQPCPPPYGDLPRSVWPAPKSGQGSSGSRWDDDIWQAFIQAKFTNDAAAWDRRYGGPTQELYLGTVNDTAWVPQRSLWSTWAGPWQCPISLWLELIRRFTISHVPSCSILGNSFHSKACKTSSTVPSATELALHQMAPEVLALFSGFCTFGKSCHLGFARYHSIGLCVGLIAKVGGTPLDGVQGRWGNLLDCQTLCPLVWEPSRVIALQTSSFYHLIGK